MFFPLCFFWTYLKAKSGKLKKLPRKLKKATNLGKMWGKFVEAIEVTRPFPINRETFSLPPPPLGGPSPPPPPPALKTLIRLFCFELLS